MKLAVYSQWEKSRDTAFLGMLDYHPYAEVIDLGCGDGKFSKRVKVRIGNETMIGADLGSKLLEKAKTEGIFINKADLDNPLPFKTKEFDVIVSNQVIEHLVYPIKFMKEVYRILKPGGYAVISTENLSSWDNIISLLFGYMPFSMQFDRIKIGNPFSPYDKERIGGFPSHVRIFSFQGLIDFFKFYGFKIEKVSALGYLPFNFLANLDQRHARFITVKVRK